jgi:hypothetical protein
LRQASQRRSRRRRSRPPRRRTGRSSIGTSTVCSWYESYRDIEWYDDEITSVVSYRDAVTLADLIELDLRRMFGADDTALTFADLAAALRVRLDETALEQLENELGWELAGALADPTTFAEFSLDGLADVAAPVGLDWRHLLPLARRAAG